MRRGKRGHAGPYRIIAAIPFAIGEQVCKEVVAWLLGPSDPWHPSYLSNAEFDERHSLDR